MPSIDRIITRSISPSSVSADGPLTYPRTYGVYRIPTSAGSTRRFRFGNHPIRQRELEIEFGSCQLEYLFTDREDAKAVAKDLAERR